MPERILYRPEQQPLFENRLWSNFEASPAEIQYAVISKAIEKMSNPLQLSRRVNLNY
jgi:hypothetical protein